MPSVFFFSLGHEMNVVDTFVPMISSTELWMSASVILLMCPFLTWPESQICRGFELNMAKLDVLSVLSAGLAHKRDATAAQPMQGYLPNRIQDGEEPALESILEHI